MYIIGTKNVFEERRARQSEKHIKWLSTEYMGHEYVPEYTGADASRRYEVVYGRWQQRHEDCNAHVVVFQQVQRILSWRSSVWPLADEELRSWCAQHSTRSSAALPSATQRNRISNKKNQKIMIRQKQQKDNTTAARAAEQARLNDGRVVNSQVARYRGPGPQQSAPYQPWTKD